MRQALLALLLAAVLAPAANAQSDYPEGAEKGWTGFVRSVTTIESTAPGYSHTSRYEAEFRLQEDGSSVVSLNEQRLLQQVETDPDGGQCTHTWSRSSSHSETVRIGDLSPGSPAYQLRFDNDPGSVEGELGWHIFLARPPEAWYSTETESGCGQHGSKQILVGPPDNPLHGSTDNLGPLQRTATGGYRFTGGEVEQGSTQREEVTWDISSDGTDQEPPPGGPVKPTPFAPVLELEDQDHKVELAEDGAKAAEEGAAGCFLTAGAIAGAEVTGTEIVIGGGGEAAAGLTQFGQFLSMVADLTVGNCVTGIVGTVSNGIQLAVDPPDPQYRRVGLPATLAPPKTPSSCPPGVSTKSCRAALVAVGRYAKAAAREASIAEAVAIAANRFGNAAGKSEWKTAHLQRAAWRGHSGALVGARKETNVARKELAAALKSLDITSIRFAAAAIDRARAEGAEAVPSALEKRLTRGRLIENHAGLEALVSGFTQTFPAGPGRNLLSPRSSLSQARQASAQAGAVDLGLVARSLIGASKAPKAARRAIAAELKTIEGCKKGVKAAIKRFQADVARYGRQVLGVEGTTLVKALAAAAYKNARC